MQVIYLENDPKSRSKQTKKEKRYFYEQVNKVSAIGKGVWILHRPPAKCTEAPRTVPLGVRRLHYLFHSSHCPLVKFLHFLAELGCHLADSQGIEKAPGQRQKYKNQVLEAASLRCAGVHRDLSTTAEADISSDFRRGEMGCHGTCDIHPEFF